jgi:hypothetical protein
MWLATLNPGKTARRGKRRRKLSAWQRMVKKAGGVMQAVKLSRKLKRKRTKGSSRRRFRRNSYLTTALTSGGAVIGMNAPRRKKRSRSKIRSRRSAVSRRSRRSRSRKAMRRSQMARKTRRRRHKTPSRGRGGRFMKSTRRHRRSSRRRTRRNPVLPISWNPTRRRRRRSRRNPLFLSRKGFSGRKHSGYRRLHRRRHSPRYWHNPSRRRSHRRYRRNPVLPISWNPVSALGMGGPVGSVLGRVKSFIDVRFWTETGLPAASGFFGSKAVGGFVYNQIPVSILQNVPAAAFPYVRMATDALGGAGLAWLVGRFIGKKQGDMVWLGTVVNVAYSALKAVLGGTDIARTIGLDGLGDDLASRMKQEIAGRVQNSLNGLGSYLRTTNVRGSMGEYVTEGAMRMSNAFSPGDRLGDSDLGDPGF